MQTNNAWPAIGFEVVSWQSEQGVLASRRQLRQAAGPYKAAVLPKIATQKLVLAAELGAELEDAAAELVRFDAENQDLLFPFAGILLRTESASSSEIENLTVSAKQLALAELGGSKSPNANQVLANVHGMQAALSLSSAITAESIIQMQRALLHSSKPNQVGSWRKEQVWIGGGSISPHNAEFVPPKHEDIQENITDLLAFMDRDDLPVLAQIALAHAQFETIHPFTDGNGRTGRAIIQAMLRGKGLTRSTLVPVSAGLLSDTNGYFAALGSYRAGDPVPIMRVFVDAAFRAVQNGRTLKTDLDQISQRWKDQLQARSDSVAHKLRTYLLQQPVISIAQTVAMFGITAPVALVAIEKLVAINALEKTSENRRNRTWQAPEVLAALEGFGQRARRQ